MSDCGQRSPCQAQFKQLPLATSFQRLGLALLTLLFVFGTSAQETAVITTAGTIEQPALAESSGLTASGIYPEVFWSHNDTGSGNFLFALTSSGQHLGAYEVQGAALIDWEAVAADNLGNLYLADTGTNGLARTHSAIHLVKEPSLEKRWGPVPVLQTWYIRFPVEREDCESLFVLDGFAYLISKYPRRGTVGLYRFPLSATGDSIQLEAVTRITTPSQISDAALSPDGSKLALISGEGVIVIFIDRNPASAGTAYRQSVRLENTLLEGIAFRNNDILVTGEASLDILRFSSPLLSGAPVITRHLASQAVYAGATLEFRVEALAVPAPTFTWFFNGQVIPNHLGPVLLLANVTEANSGLYEVIVSNPNGSARSSATLTVRAVKPDVRVTEIMSFPSNESSLPTADWFELTNIETNSVDLSGWRFNDNSGGLADAFVIPAGTTIAPGQSIIFVQTLTPDQFRAWWGPANLRRGLKIITYPEAGLGLSDQGDSIRIWESFAIDESTVLIDVTFGPAEEGVSFSYDPATGDLDPSRVGVNGAFRSATGTDIGSPGVVRGTITPPEEQPDLRITEVMSAPVGDATIEVSDWWELTSFHTNNVNLLLWRFNDESGGLTDPFIITNSIIIAPSESIIFVRDLTREQFLAWWGASRMPAGTQIITYSGDGLGFDLDGDELKLWSNRATEITNVVDQVVFGPADPGLTFIYNPDTGLFGEKSQLGLHGAFKAQIGPDIGSPGRITGTVEQFPNLKITELMANPAPAPVPTADWWELTNLDTNSVDLSGWRFNDDQSFVNAFTIPPGVTIAPNESIIFVEGLTPEEFQNWWGIDGVPPAIKVIPYFGTGLSFSSQRDSLYLWDDKTPDTNAFVIHETFEASPLGVSFNYNPESGLFGELSERGVNGVYRALNGSDIGSPGFYTARPLPPEGVDLRITEIMADPTDAAVNTADWWELTSFAAAPIDLSNWRFNDNLAFSDAFLIPEGTVIEPGEIIILVEGLSAEEFLEWWGTANIPPDAQIITYSGTGLGFNAAGDSLYFWSPTAPETQPTLAVDFPPSDPGVSFGYNTPTGEFPSTSELGLNGAFQAENAGDIASPGRIAGEPAPPVEGDIRITEVMSSPADPLTTEDWFEITNFGTNVVDLSGWRFDDNIGGFADAFVFPAGITIAPDESIIFVQALDSQAFLNWWGSANIKPGTRIFTYTGIGLSANGDSVVLWDSAAGPGSPPAALVTFGQADPGKTFALNRSTGRLEISQEGVNRAFRSATGTDIGSPGIVGGEITPPPPAPDLRITEAMSAPNDGPVDSADWWELTSFHTNSVNLLGWRFDDSSASLSAAYTITNNIIIAPGESIIFVEGLSADAFLLWWGTQNNPSGTQISSYGGPGLGLNPTADSIVLWDPAATNPAHHVARANFGAADQGVTFIYNPQTGQLDLKSQAGVNGAVIAANGGDVGSPGKFLVPESNFAISTSAAPGVIQILFQGTANQAYRLQYTHTFGSSNWISSDKLLQPATTGLLMFEEPITAETRFFRIVEEP